MFPFITVSNLPSFNDKFEIMRRNFPDVYLFTCELTLKQKRKSSVDWQYTQRKTKERSTFNLNHHSEKDN